MKFFKHSGDLGDIIFSLPTIRALGGGFLLLDPKGGQSSDYVRFVDKTRTKLNENTITGLTPLLEAQDYISGVSAWMGEDVDYDLDEFRTKIKYNNLSDSHLACFDLDFSERDKAWLDVEPIHLGKKIVINRSPKVHGNHGFWEGVLPRIKDECVFVGFEKEHEILQYTFGHDVEYYKTDTIMDLARVIKGCEQFMGNQSFAHSLAEAMKKDLIHEVYRVYPAAVFKREGAQYV